ncbi:MAG: glycosyltransferase family 2 protein, partial [Deltaproteobacteria bacterium]|nr:glycosyltransferase family 2 protein [Deltaproteobacteria bacterium]
MVVPAYRACHTVGAVVAELRRLWPERGGVFVVDDGS